MPDGRPDVTRADAALVDPRVVLDSAVIVTTPDDVITMWNHAAERLYGWAEREVLGRSISDVLVPADAQALATEIMDSVVGGDDFHGDFSVVRRVGDIVRVLVHDRVVTDARGTALAVVGVSEDVGDRRRLEQHASDLTDRLRNALDAGGLGTFVWDMVTGSVTWDERLHELFGVRPGEFDGTFDAYISLLHPDDVAHVRQTLDDALVHKGQYVVEHRVVWRDGSVHWIEGKGQITLTADGEVRGAIGCSADVTERMLLQREREAALTRLEVLTAINDALAVSDSVDDVMRNAAHAAVTRFASWCSIFVLPETGSRVPMQYTAHPDPAMVEHERVVREQFPYDAESNVGAPAVIATGRTQFYAHVDDAMLAAFGMPDELRVALGALGVRSVIDVPLAKRDRVIGALQFVASDADRRFTADDVTLAEAIASRIASTIENRRLAERQRMVATTLQASLLPPALPVVPGLDIAVRYWVGGDGLAVGGDFYDVFAVDDHWAAVIGDVCGTGPAAASLTGLARHTIRSVAWLGSAPDEVLVRLNDAVRASEQQTFCTALFAALRREGDDFVVDIASGGHPLPILRRADGRCETVGRAGTLLGLLPQIRTAVESVTLHPGDTLVLYTDGVTDVRPPHDLSAKELRALVEDATREIASASDVAEALRDAIETRLPLSARDDDMALLVVRVE